jgi:hypothetical protein
VPKTRSWHTDGLEDLLTDQRLKGIAAILAHRKLRTLTNTEEQVQSLSWNKSS